MAPMKVLIAAVGAAALAAAPAVHAEPVSPSGGDSAELAASACEFKLTPPTLTELPGGGRAVTAQLTPSSCTPKSLPFNSTICIASPDGSNTCDTANAWLVAEVFATSAQFEGKFTANGNGCSRVFVGNSTQLVCVPLSPVELVL